MMTAFFSHPRLRLRRAWISILAIAFLLAIVISGWSSVQCAFGQCGQRDQWCNGDCSQSCQDSTRLGYVDGCTLQAGICRDVWNPDKAAVRCSNTGNCNVTTVVSGPNRLTTRGGYSYWDAKQCRRTPSRGRCNVLLPNVSRVDCCTEGSNPTPTPIACTPTYDPPSVSLAGTTPPYPLTIGQDPDKLGFDATILIEGGRKTNSCNRGPAQRTITDVTLDSLELSEETIDWIEQDLALWYPGAHVKDYYPQNPYAIVTINGTTASLVFHHDPLDPGTYEATVTATQDDGKTTEAVLEIPVYLFEATIVK